MGWLNVITNSMDMSLSKFQADGEGQGSLMGYSPRGHQELDSTGQLNNTIYIYIYIYIYICAINIFIYV